MLILKLFSVQILWWFHSGNRWMTHTIIRCVVILAYFSVVWLHTQMMYVCTAFAPGDLGSPLLCEDKYLVGMVSFMQHRSPIMVYTLGWIQELDWCDGSQFLFYRLEWCVRMCWDPKSVKLPPGRSVSERMSFLQNRESVDWCPWHCIYKDEDFYLSIRVVSGGGQDPELGGSFPVCCVLCFVVADAFRIPLSRCWVQPTQQPACIQVPTVRYIADWFVDKGLIQGGTFGEFTK